jgi:hypothetical protein
MGHRGVDIAKTESRKEGVESRHQGLIAERGPRGSEERGREGKAKRERWTRLGHEVGHVARYTYRGDFERDNILTVTGGLCHVGGCPALVYLR